MDPILTFDTVIAIVVGATGSAMTYAGVKGNNSILIGWAVALTFISLFVIWGSHH